MAKETTGTKTSYIVLREIDLRVSSVEEILNGENANRRLFVTDETVAEVSSADQACRRAAEQAGVDGFYATVPKRSWDPAEYVVEQRPVARRKTTQETLPV